MSIQLPYIDSAKSFPDPLISNHFEGLVGFSFEITTEMLKNSYPKGIFPWYAPPDPVLWWATNPRMVLQTQNLKISRSLRKRLLDASKGIYRSEQKTLTLEIVMDRNPEAVMNACSEPRIHQTGTWITPELKKAYLGLFDLGHLHSIEILVNGNLEGGLYGVSFGRMFYGESMFHHLSDLSKIALCTLVTILRKEQVPWIDCQQETAHLSSLGASAIDLKAFLNHLNQYCKKENPDWDAYRNKILNTQLIDLIAS